MITPHQRGGSQVEHVGAGKNEVRHKADLCSEGLDSVDGAAPRSRYVIFSAQRTGSELLCDYLRERGIGIPFEYFNHAHMPRIAGRLGCMLPDGRVNVMRYIALLEPRRAKNGIYGTKLQPDQLRTISRDDSANAREMLRRFDRIVLLRRRDKLLQAISLARAHLTNQWQLYGDDAAVPISCGEDVLFAMIAFRLGKILEDERYMTELLTGLEPHRVRCLWYEDSSDRRALAATAEWLWAASGLDLAPPEPERRQELPRKMDDREARGIKARFLAAVGAERCSADSESPLPNAPQ
jgi:LPS sulfotransferase NodH